MRHVKRIVPRTLTPHLASAYRRFAHQSSRLDRALDRRTLSRARFRQLLEELGIRTGATVMVHSSMDRIGRRVPDLNAFALVRLLQQCLGPDGTLLMPTFVFQGLQRDYLETHDTFDPRNAPSQVGLLTEVFRRMPGVLRSLHPTHPVAGWGRHAHDLLATHHLGLTFGPTSPIYKLREYGGLVVGLGTSMRESFTIQHVPEELHARTREDAYEARSRVMTIIDGSRRIPYTLRVMRPDDGQFDDIEKLLLNEGTLKYINRRGLKCAVTDADRFVTRTLDLIDQGMYRFKRGGVSTRHEGGVN